MGEKKVFYQIIPISTLSPAFLSSKSLNCINCYTVSWLPLAINSCNLTKRAEPLNPHHQIREEVKNIWRDLESNPGPLALTIRPWLLKHLPPYQKSVISLFIGSLFQRPWTSCTRHGASCSGEQVDGTSP